MSDSSNIRKLRSYDNGAITTWQKVQNVPNRSVYTCIHDHHNFRGMSEKYNTWHVPHGTRLFSRRMGWITFSPGAIYFIYCIALGTLTPFLGVILSEKGLSEFEIGVALACVPLVTFMAAPLGAFLFDHTHQSKWVWGSYILLSAVSMQLLMWTENWYAVMCVISLSTLFSAPIMGIIDHSVLVFLGDRKSDYGYYRLWGAVSWGIIAVIMGVILSHYSYEWAFIGYLLGQLSLLLFVIVTRFSNDSASLTIDQAVPPKTLSEESVEDGLTTLEDIEEDVSLSEDDGKETKEKDAELESSVVHLEEEEESPDTLIVVPTNQLMIILYALAKGKVLVFYFTVFIMGIGTYLINAFLFLFLQDLGGSETLMGLTLTFTVLTEIPFFFYSGTILRWFGEEWLIFSAMMAYIVRVVGYSVLQNPWWVLPLELLHGLTFGAMYAAGIHYSSKLLPAELSATAQGLFGGVYNGIGPLTGSIVGGWLYEHVGPREMFQIMAGIVTVGLFILCTTFHREMLSYLVNLRTSLRNRKLEGSPSSSEVELEELEVEGETPDPEKEDM